MTAPLLLLALSAAGIVAAFTVPGWGDVLLLSVPCVVASLWLSAKAILRRLRPWAVIDGSNVMHWRGGSPSLAPLRDTVATLTARGFRTLIVFDANAGHVLAGRYLSGPALAARIGVRRGRVIVVDKGSAADPVILACARRLGARVITNDRYREWAHAHPEVTRPDFLVRGRYRTGRLHLPLDRT